MLKSLRSLLRKCSLPTRKKHCPHMVVAVKRWRPLRAWCRMLRGRLSVAYTNEEGQDGLATRSRFQSLVLTLDESEDAIPPRERAKIRDAIELVVLALQVAPKDAWEQIVRVLCGTPDFFPANHLESELEPRLVVRHVAYGTFQYDSIDVFDAMWLDGSRSKSYHRTRKWLMAHADRQTEIKPVPLLLELTTTLADMAHGSTQYLHRILAMAQKLQGTMPMVIFDGLNLDLRALEINERGCAVLRKLQQTGTRIDSLMFCPVDHDIGEEGSAFSAMLNDRANPIHKLVLDNSSGLAPPSVWQTLRLARGLKKVEIIQSPKGSDDERRLIAQWQAYALLDPRSPTSIEWVRFIDGSIYNAEIAAMIEVVDAEHPESLVNAFGRSLNPSPYRPKRLKMLQLPTSPGNDEEMAEALQLLTLVGSNLETLAWSVDRAEIKHNHLRSLFLACPRLRRLRLQSAQLQDIDCLITIFQAGLCRSLESLIFEDSVILERSSLLRFLSACNDPRKLVNRSLKDFAYDNYLHESVLADLIPIIARNTTLRHVGIRVTSFGMVRHREQLKQLHLAPLPMQQAPLQVESKVAFMRSALAQLNSDVCHKIFEFAGQSVRRKVVCLVYDWIRLPNRFEL